MPFGWVAAGTAAVSAVAGIAGSAMQADATKSAQSSANAAQEAAEARARADLKPYNDAGQNALLVTSDLAGANGVEAGKNALLDYTASPGYQWQLSEGLRGVDAGAAAKGMLRSGSTLKGEIDYAQGLAKQDFNSYYDKLFNLTRLGENAAAKTGDQSITTGQGIAGTDVSSGAAQSSIYGNAAKGVSDAGNQYAKNSLYSSGLSSGGGGSNNYTNPADGRGYYSDPNLALNF